MKSVGVLLLAALIAFGLVSAQDTGGVTGGDTGGDAQIGGSLVGEGGMTGGDLEAAENITGGPAAGGATGGMTGGADVDGLAGGADDVTGGDLSGGDAASMTGPDGDMAGGSTTGGATGGGATGGSAAPNAADDLDELVSSYGELGTLIERLESDTEGGAMNVDDATLNDLRRIYDNLGRMLEQVRGEGNN